jgi:hypothetical protein
MSCRLAAWTGSGGGPGGSAMSRALSVMVLAVRDAGKIAYTGKPSRAGSSLDATHRSDFQRNHRSA